MILTLFLIHLLFANGATIAEWRAESAPVIVAHSDVVAPQVAALRIVIPAKHAAHTLPAPVASNQPDWLPIGTARGCPTDPKAPGQCPQPTPTPYGDGSDPNFHPPCPPGSFDPASPPPGNPACQP